MGIQSDPRFALQDIPGKGRGLVASQAFERGDVILHEKPLFIAPKEYRDLSGRHDSKEAMAFREAYLTKLVAALAPSEREAVWDLQDIWSERQGTPKRLSGIVHTNSLSGSEDLGIFAVGSYFNHSCLPTVNYFWCEGERGGEGPSELFTAARDIKVGEELTIYYNDMKQPRARRRHLLQASFNCVCRCEVCSLEGDLQTESDAKRCRMTEIKGELDALWTEGQFNPRCLHRTLPLALELIRLTVDEFQSDPWHMESAFAEGFEAAYACGKGELARKMAYNQLAAKMHTEGHSAKVPHGNGHSLQALKAICMDPRKHNLRHSFSLNVRPKDLQPVLASVREGGFACLSEEIGMPVWPSSHTPVSEKESERDRRERVRRETEAKKAETAAKNRRRRKNKKNKKKNAKKTKGRK
ncbi:hypothetical protein KIPB_008572 [Kipferlia bialata]|uniref:SET domain-containing protein n=1 Tax=Kipferlia bialata TaxID=797122 RepID=A0A9K3D1V0_9EUKA|nr:hypothetical protein KIPB_008572 [Kipferlia bialata]|eukprot:g8572.t1